MMLVSLAFVFSLEGEATTDPEYTERNCCLFYTRKGNGSHGSGSLYRQCSCLHVPRKQSSHVTVLQNVSRWCWDPFPSVNAVLEKTIKRAVWRWVIGSGFLCSRSQATWKLDHLPFFWQASRDAPSPQPELLLVTSEDQVSWHLLESAGTVMTSVVNCWVREAEMKQVGCLWEVLVMLKLGKPPWKLICVRFDLDPGPLSVMLERSQTQLRSLQCCQQMTCLMF